MNFVKRIAKLVLLVGVTRCFSNHEADSALDEISAMHRGVSSVWPFGA